MDTSSLGKRIAFALIAGMALGAFVAITWSAMGFLIAGSLRGVKSETVGLSTIILAPGGGLVAFVLGLGIGMIPYGPRPWLRWVITAGACLAGGLALFLSMLR